MKIRFYYKLARKYMALYAQSQRELKKLRELYIASNDESIKANKDRIDLTIENFQLKRQVFDDISITFVDRDNNEFRIIFNSYSDHDNLLAYINAASLLKENIYFDKNKNIFQIKEWVWKYYEKGASWYRVEGETK